MALRVCFAIYFIAMRKEEIYQPVFAAHEKLSYCQLHEDSIPELAFWRHISGLMEVCGISDFTREDLTRPTTVRLKKQLSAIINFAKFREEQYQMYDEITTARDAQLARLSTIDGENAALQDQLDQLIEKNKAQVSLSLSGGYFPQHLDKHSSFILIYCKHI
jgi:kinetochore protein Nuf2